MATDDNIDEIQKRRYEQTQKYEPWRDVFGTYVDQDIIDQETAVFLYNNDFRSLKVLQQLPVDNLEELKILLKECPNIEKLGKQMAIKWLVHESKKGVPVLQGAEAATHCGPNHAPPDYQSALRHPVAESTTTVDQRQSLLGNNPSGLLQQIFDEVGFTTVHEQTFVDEEGFSTAPENEIEASELENTSFSESIDTGRISPSDAPPASGERMITWILLEVGSLSGIVAANLPYVDSIQACNKVIGIVIAEL
uniref:Uncharacterized protein n=1 Tax=Plectus sambesii TaxID=2011161 RepID=A0A914XCA2_9BILA